MQVFWVWTQRYRDDARIIAVDFRDVVFQASPFRCLPTRRAGAQEKLGEMTFFAESMKIFQHKMDRRMLVKCFGKGAWWARVVTNHTIEDVYVRLVFLSCSFSLDPRAELHLICGIWLLTQS